MLSLPWGSGLFGVVKFDDSAYQEALTWLEESYAHLRNIRLSPHYLISQLYTAMGIVTLLTSLSRAT